jgi:Na+/citrate or Na+/malate symporter
VTLPPLLNEHPRSLQIFLAIILPVAFGALTGYFLGVSESTYLVLSILGILGGFGAGFDHRGAREGAMRGVLAGLLFGASILIAHEIHGAEAEAHLPEPAILLVVITTVLGALFAAIGGWMRERAMSKAAA